MRVGLIVDSACDLPHEFFRKHDLFVLPVTAIIDGHTYLDTRDPVRTQEFYDLFMDEIVTQYDVAICETVTRSRSQVFDHASEAMNMVMANYQHARSAAGREGKFSMRVIDSKQIFAGQGLLAAHTLRLIDQQLSKNSLRHQVEVFTDRIYTCVIPRDLHYIRERARRRGDNNVSAVAAFLGKVLNINPVIFGQGVEGKPVAKTRDFHAAVEKVMNYAIGRVEAGLLTPYVSLSCGLSWAEIDALPGLDQLRETCKKHGVELLLSQMGITSSIYVGPGSLCLALAAGPHEFADFQ